MWFDTARQKIYFNLAQGEIQGTLILIRHPNNITVFIYKDEALLKKGEAISDRVLVWVIYVVAGLTEL